MRAKAAADKKCRGKKGRKKEREKGGGREVGRCQWDRGEQKTKKRGWTHLVPSFWALS